MSASGDALGGSARGGGGGGGTAADRGASRGAEGGAKVGAGAGRPSGWRPDDEDEALDQTGPVSPVRSAARKVGATSEASAWPAPRARAPPDPTRPPGPSAVRAPAR